MSQKTFLIWGGGGQTKFLMATNSKTVTIFSFSIKNPKVGGMGQVPSSMDGPPIIASDMHSILRSENAGTPNKIYHFSE